MDKTEEKLKRNANLFHIIWESCRLPVRNQQVCVLNFGPNQHVTGNF